MRNDLIIDFETLSKDSSSCAIIDCSAMFFQWEKFTSSNPYGTKDVFLVKKFKFSVEDQVKNYGWKIDKETLDFWGSQNANVRKNIIPKKCDLSVEQFTDKFTAILSESGKIDYWWSRSNTFDPIILTRIFKSQNLSSRLEKYLKFYRVRDTRTFIDSKLSFPKNNAFIPISNEHHWKENFQAHDSAWDILADVLRIQAIVRAENDLEMIER